MISSLKMSLADLHEEMGVHDGKGGEMGRLSVAAMWATYMDMKISRLFL